MSLPDNKRVKAYLKGSMSTSEKLDFEFELKKRPELQEMVDQAQDGQTESESKLSNILVGLVLGVSILFLGFSALYWHAHYNYTSNAILEKFQYEAFDFEHYDQLVAADSINDLDRQLIVMGHQYFKSNNFFQANDIFEEMLEESIQDTLMFGKHGRNYVIENAQWNRIISYLTINNDENNDLVNQYLQDIVSNDDHQFINQANQLLEYRMSFMHDLANAN